MKQRTKGAYLPAVLLLLLFAACKKEEPQFQKTDFQLKGTGLVPDDEAKLARLHVIVSSNYMKLKTAPGSGKGRNGSTSTTSDITPPSITITSPAGGSEVSGTVAIGVSASDNVKVTTVFYTVDGASIGSSSTAPFGISWNTSTFTDGLHTLQAKAVDAAGNWAVYSIGVSKNTAVVQPPPPSSGFSLSMPPIADQGSEGSCVSFAVGYAARSAEWFHKNSASSYIYSSNVFSPEFLYNMTKVSTDCGAGSAITTALDYMKANGICTWQSMPYSYTNGCSLAPTAAQFSEADSYKISGYSGLYKSDVAGIKATLAAGHPLIFGASLDNSFINAAPGFIWKSYTTGAGPGHAMVIVGYDDSRNAWKIMNSWGTGWGDGGYGWIDYNFFPQTGGSWVFVIN